MSKQAQPQARPCSPGRASVPKKNKAASLLAVNPLGVGAVEETAGTCTNTPTLGTTTRTATEGVPITYGKWVK